MYSRTPATPTWRASAAIDVPEPAPHDDGDDQLYTPRTQYSDDGDDELTLFGEDDELTTTVRILNVHQAWVSKEVWDQWSDPRYLLTVTRRWLERQQLDRLTEDLFHPKLFGDEGTRVASVSIRQYLGSSAGIREQLAGSGSTWEQMAASGSI